MELSDNSTPPIRNGCVIQVFTALLAEDQVPEDEWWQRSQAAASRREMESLATADEISEARRRLQATKNGEAKRARYWAEHFVCQLGIEAARRESAARARTRPVEATALQEVAEKACTQPGFRCELYCPTCWVGDERIPAPGSGEARPRNSASSTGAASNTHITSTGGTGMGIEQVQAAIVGVNERVSTAAQQMSGVQSELGEASSMLAAATQGTRDTEVTDALGELRRLGDEIERLSQQALQAGEQAMSYAGRL